MVLSIPTAPRELKTRGGMAESGRDEWVQAYVMVEDVGAALTGHSDAELRRCGALPTTDKTSAKLSILNPFVSVDEVGLKVIHQFNQWADGSEPFVRAQAPLLRALCPWTRWGVKERRGSSFQKVVFKCSNARRPSTLC